MILFLYKGIISFTGGIFLSTSLKLILGFFSIVFLASISLGIFFYVTGSDSESAADGTNPLENLSGPEDSELAQLERGEKKFEVSSARQGNEISEMAFADDLHEMTHQKVMAEEKWGHKRITEESIEEMLGIAEESNYEYKDFYIDTLKRWQAGDFNNAVKVHNIIWNANNGTIGKAERLLSPREEQNYIIEHFE